MCMYCMYVYNERMKVHHQGMFVFTYVCIYVCMYLFLWSPRRVRAESPFELAARTFLTLPRSPDVCMSERLAC